MFLKKKRSKSKINIKTPTISPLPSKIIPCILLSYKEMVGMRGFEPPTPYSRSRYATSLRYIPTVLACFVKEFFEVFPDNDRTYPINQRFKPGAPAQTFLAVRVYYFIVLKSFYRINYRLGVHDICNRIFKYVSGFCLAVEVHTAVCQIPIT